MMPSAMDSPAEGPPMLFVRTNTLIGKLHDFWVLGSIPRYAVGLPVPHKPSVSPLGGVPRVILRCTIGPLTNRPEALTEDCSTESVAVDPGCNPCNALVSEQIPVTALPLTAVITWETLSTLYAGVPGVVPKTSAPTLRSEAVYPR